MARRFVRRKEDFSCLRCGVSVNGNGYTNHCPACLWSKHVDINPGDRENSCGGLMEPMKMEVKKGDYIILHQCQKCGAKKRNKAAPEDCFTELVKLTGYAPELLHNP